MITTISATLPILVLIVMLMAVKSPAWLAALAALAVGAIQAGCQYSVGVKDLAACSLEGALTGLYPIGLVIVAALFTYGVTVESGAIGEIKSGLAKLSPDKRFFALLTVWGFGNFMEGMAGFGTAVAIPCAILMGVGFDPVKAVLCALVANTTPTAFGSVGVPTMMLAKVTELEASHLTSVIACVQLLVTALSPFLILFIVDGLKGVRECFKLALLADVAFLVPWLLTAMTLGCELPNVLGGLAVMAVLAMKGNWRELDGRKQAQAWLPFALVVAVLGLSAAFVPAQYKLSPGVLILLAAIPGGLMQKVSFVRLARLLIATIRKYSLALLTICQVLALAKIMGQAGMTAQLADALIAATGNGYALFSTAVGALGGFVTGSGTSSNVLFGSLQASVGANEAQRYLFAAANVMGAGIGKMICPQSIVLGCAATGLAGRESTIMGKAFGWFLLVLTLACLTVFVANLLP